MSDFYNNMKVSVSLGDLATILNAANCWEIATDKCEGMNIEISKLNSRINEAERELAKWKSAKNTDKPRANAIAYLDNHNTPFEYNETDQACDVIRALLAATPESATPRELQPVTITAIKNAKDVLNALYRPIIPEEDAAKESVPCDRFQSVYKTLDDLVLRLEQEGLA